MFNAGSMQQFFHQAAGYGFELGSVDFKWSALKSKRDAYVKRLNGIYERNLDNSGVEFIVGDAKFTGAKEVTVGDKTYTADTILIAVGGKPVLPDVPGIEHAIESDGFFELEELPGKVAVIGSGYIAVELAGILKLLGAEVDLLIRGDRPLKTMDSSVTDMLVAEMKEEGVNFVKGEVASISEADGVKSLHLKDGGEMAGYDTVLFAVGRTPVTASLNLASAGVETTKGGHVVVDKLSRANADGVYAVGDVIGTGVDLTPTAIAAGRLLSDRLFGGVPEEQTIMDYDMVPTVVFSHPPLAVMGLTEEQAIEKHGADQVTIHKTTFVNMLYSREFLVEDQFQPKTFAKLVCIGPEQRVIGLHMIGLAVDEILQGFSVAIKMGATKADFDSAVAIHPTSSEELVTIPPWQAKYKIE
uniref:Glutathione-disulfide reductase n=1 Tax=Haptolina ericina TaxID=156174 RepID=A0A7S3AYT5_9EUKA